MTTFHMIKIIESTGIGLVYGLRYDGIGLSCVGFHMALNLKEKSKVIVFFLSLSLLVLLPENSLCILTVNYISCFRYYGNGHLKPEEMIIYVQHNELLWEYYRKSKEIVPEDLKEDIDELYQGEEFRVLTNG